MTAPTNAATLDLLNWVAARTAPYSEALDVWQTSCPRSSVWEDSFIDGLLCVERTNPSAEPTVALTARGRSIVQKGAFR